MIDRNWIPIAEAARRIEASGPVVRRLIDSGQLTVRRLPGCHQGSDQIRVIICSKAGSRLRSHSSSCLSHTSYVSTWPSKKTSVILAHSRLQNALTFFVHICMKKLEMTFP
jgi:hypothetical protein